MLFLKTPSQLFLKASVMLTSFQAIFSENFWSVDAWLNSVLAID